VDAASALFTQGAQLNLECRVEEFARFRIPPEMRQNNRVINHALCREEMPVAVCLARNGVGSSAQFERLAELVLPEMRGCQIVQSGHQTAILRA